MSQSHCKTFGVFLRTTFYEKASHANPIRQRSSRKCICHCISCAKKFAHELRFLDPQTIVHPAANAKTCRGGGVGDSLSQRSTPIDVGVLHR